MKLATEIIRGVVLVIALSAFASGFTGGVGVKETARLTVTGTGLSEPLTVTDPGTLSLSNVFRGAFFGGPASEPDAAWSRFTITFDIQTREGVKVSAYVLLYSRNPKTGEGFIYLPGRGDDAYRLNMSTIWREDLEGKWHRAAAEWSEAINSRLP